MVHSRITTLLESLASDTPPFPPTVLYNEGWLLRLTISWFSSHPVTHYPLAFAASARWFSEALLPSAFVARFRGDPLAESRTHSDGVIGHITIGSNGKADLSIQSGATQFVALEAKIFSSLSSGTKNVKTFDQVARNVACVAEILRRANCPASEFAQLGFYLLAPEIQIRRGLFENQTNKESIWKKVEQRVKSYAGEKDHWFFNWFVPTLKLLDIRIISWEDILRAIEVWDTAEGQQLEDFYVSCLRFNSPAQSYK